MCIKLNAGQMNAFNSIVKIGKNEILGINSPAGTGKTQLLKYSSNKLLKQNDKGLYLAFNRKIVNNVKDDISDNFSSFTFHELSRRYMYKYDDVKDVQEPEFEEPRDILAMKSIDRFCMSKETKYLSFFGCNNRAIYIYEQMVAGNITPSHNVVLKMFHISLKQKKHKIKTKLLAIDECQDLNPVMIEITKLIKARRKVIVGDMNQHIYSFMGAVNAFEKLDVKEILKLTENYRFSAPIRERIEKFVDKFLKE